jgi:hypothetical protein
MFHARPALRAHDVSAWAALVSGAADLTANPLEGLDNWIEGDPGVGLDDEDDDLPCEVCGGTGTLTRTVGLGPEGKPCWECLGEW